MYLRNCFTIFFILCSSSHLCYADWVLIKRDNKVNVYIDDKSITKGIEGIKVNWIYNYPEKHRAGTKKTGYYEYQSYSFVSEYNCSERQSRLYSSTPYFEAMAQRPVLTKIFEPKWERVGGSYESIGDIVVFEYVCR